MVPVHCGGWEGRWAGDETDEEESPEVPPRDLEVPLIPPFILAQGVTLGSPGDSDALKRFQVHMLF